MATLPIHLEVEDVAVGPVLIMLKRTPGIIKMNLILDKELAAPVTPRIAGGPSIEQTVMALLIKATEPVPVAEIVAAVGGRNRAYGALHGLKRKGIARNLGQGLWSLTDKARKDTQKLLPAPKANGHAHLPKHHAKPIATTPSGRAPKGMATTILLQALTEKPLTTAEVGPVLEAGGSSSKSISGVLERTKGNGLIRKNKSTGQWELTAKGLKQANKADEQQPVESEPATAATEEA